MNDLKNRLINNKFVERIRESLQIDEGEYNELCQILEAISKSLKDVYVIDKELALILYSEPQMVRNAFLSFANHEDPPEIASRLEDIWVELDGLVMECLSS